MTLHIDPRDYPWVNGNGILWQASPGHAHQEQEPLPAARIPPAAEPNKSEPFPDVLPASALQRRDPAAAWLWTGYLCRGEVTLFSALFKAGKTTLVAHLLRALEAGGDFCGQMVAPARVLYVAEESENRWAQRRDELSIHDHVHFLIRPFGARRPSLRRWLELQDHLGGLLARDPYDLVVLDSLANLWPVRDENDNALVGEALAPMHALTAASAVLLVHHFRKSGGDEGTAGRGAGALMGFVDTILEFRRFSPSDRECRKRVLTGYGRNDETPDEVVLELNGVHYVACGDRGLLRQQDLRERLFELLPTAPPGLTRDEILAALGRPGPRHGDLVAVLGADCVHREGEGCRGSPWTWWRQPNAAEVFPGAP